MIGTIKEHGGQRFECIAVVPYIRRDGGQSELASWKGECAYCGEPFTFKYATSQTAFYPRRRCDIHKNAGRKVTGGELAEMRRKVAAKKAEERRKAEAARQAEERRREEARRKAEAARLAEEKRLAEQAHRAEEARLKEERRKAEEARLAEERWREEERLAKTAAQKRNATLEEWRRMQDKAQAAAEVFSLNDVVWHVRRGFGWITDINGERVTVTFADQRSGKGHFRRLDLYLPPYVNEMVKHDEFGVGTVAKVGGHSDVTVNFADRPRIVGSIYLKPMY